MAMATAARAGSVADHREWIRRTLAHAPIGPVPYNLSCTPPACAALQRHYGFTDLDDFLDLPIRMTALKSIKPLYASPAEFGPTVRDEFGVLWSTSALDRGSVIQPCLPEPDLSRYTFPDLASPARFTDLGAWCRNNASHFRIVWVGDLWERATFMRGMQEVLLDLSDHPRFVDELLCRLTEQILRAMEVLFERFEFEGVAVSDDYGSQRGLLMSPAAWRRMIKPRLAEIYAFARSHGRAVFHHSCGNVRTIIGDMLDIGLDILHPIQPEAMDVFELKREFGQRVTLCGGLRTQDLLPRGTPDAIRREVRILQERLGEGGGFILEPGITLQGDIPVENLVAFVEAARNAGGR
jgi:uroporphyrinogen decarboxylase